MNEITKTNSASQEQTLNRILYGKGNLDRILSINATPSWVDIYYLDEHGLVLTKTEKNHLYIVTGDKLDLDTYHLEGKLPLNRMVVFDNYHDFNTARSRMYRRSYTPRDTAEAYMVRTGHTYYKGMKPEELVVLSFDIETTGLDRYASDAQVLLISNTLQVNGVKERKLFCYDDYFDTKSMLESWCKWVREMDPDVLTGHNILGFDLNYMLQFSDLPLGRDGSAVKQDQRDTHYRIDQQRGLEYKNVTCVGREIIDTMMLAYKYDASSKKYDSYGLKKIIATEGLEAKDRQHYDASTIRFNYKNPEEWVKIKAYAEFDADDSLALYNLMSAPYFYMAQMIPKTYQQIVCGATGSQLNALMCRAYLQEDHSLPLPSESVEFEGAISIGTSGVYKNVAKVDVASLYPSIMIEYTIKAPEKDPLEYFPLLVKTLTDRRLEYKRLAKENKQYDNLQNSFKILINSAYGFLATNGINFNSPDQAAFITKKGREILTTAISWAASRGFKLVNADTDSISYVKENQDIILPDEFKEHLKSLNSLYPQRISWEDDGIFPSVMVIKAKNYVLFDGKKVKYKGNSLKATVKSKALQEFITRMVDALMFQTWDISDLYNEYVQEILSIKDITRWSTRKTVSEKIYSSERANETKVKDALEGSDYVQGDRVRVYRKEDGSLALEENFNNDHCKKHLLKNLYSTMMVFSTVIDDIKTKVPNYSLVKNYKALLNAKTTQS